MNFNEIFGKNVGVMMMMMMMMMNWFCGMVDWQKVFSLISSQDHCQRSSLLGISDTLRARFEPALWCSSDNHYTTVPQKMFLVYNGIKKTKKQSVTFCMYEKKIGKCK